MTELMSMCTNLTNFLNTLWIPRNYLETFLTYNSVFSGASPFFLREEREGFLATAPCSATSLGTSLTSFWVSSMFFRSLISAFEASIACRSVSKSAPDSSFEIRSKWDMNGSSGPTRGGTALTHVSAYDPISAFWPDVCYCPTEQFQNNSNREFWQNFRQTHNPFLCRCKFPKIHCCPFCDS